VIYGIFSVKTTVASPPIALGLEEGISGSTKGPVHMGDTIDFEYKAKNYGFSDTPAVYLCICRNEIAHLQNEIQQLEECVSGLKSNIQQQEIQNETYI
jgi:hypothetical protein